MMRIPTGFNAEAFQEFIRQRVETILIEALSLLADECRKNVPVDTGELRDSIHIEGPWRASPFYMEGRVIAGGPGVPQAYFQEFGTVAHGPKTASVMHFFWKGEEIFTRRVRGNIPLAWMTNSANFSLPRIQALFKSLESEFSGRVFVVTIKAPVK